MLAQLRQGVFSHLLRFARDSVVLPNIFPGLCHVIELITIYDSPSKVGLLELIVVKGEHFHRQNRRFGKSTRRALSRQSRQNIQAGCVHPINEHYEYNTPQQVMNFDQSLKKRRKLPLFMKCSGGWIAEGLGHKQTEAFAEWRFGI